MIDLRNSRAFTIIELLVVVVVIGILAAVSIVAYNGVQQSARDRTVMSDVEAVDTQIARYSVKNGGKFGSAVRWYSAAASNTNIPFIPTEGNVVDVVASDDEYCIRVYNPRGGEYKTLATAAKKSYPASACDDFGPSSPALVDSPYAYNDRAVIFVAGSGYGNADGKGSAASFRTVDAMTIDDANNLYVVDGNSNNGIRKVAPNGTVSTIPVELYARGIARNTLGELFVSSGNFIRKIAPNGTVSPFVGGTTGTADGTGASAQFGSVSKMTIDVSGNLYAVDGCRIRKITPAGVVTTFVGGSPCGYQDGIGTNARFSGIEGIAAAPNGDIYVADFGSNSRIRKITPAGVVTTFAGNGQSNSNIDGNGTSAGIYAPQSIVVDSQGVIYVGNNWSLIRKITSDGAVTTLRDSNGVNSFDGGGTAVQLGGMPSSLVINSSGSVFVGVAVHGSNTIKKIR